MVGLSNHVLVRTGVWVVAGQVVAALGGIVTLRLLTELAAPQAFGEASLVLAVLALGLQLFVAPGTSTQLRFHSEAAARGAEVPFTAAVLHHSLRATTVLGGVLLLAYGVAVSLGLLAPSLAVPAAGLAWIAVTTVRNVLVGRIHAARNAVLYAGVQAVEVLLIGVCSVLLLQAHADTVSIILGQALGVGAIVLALRRWWPRAAPAGARQEEAEGLRQRIRSYGHAFVPLSLLNWGATLADRYVVAALLGAAAAGLYAAPAAVATRGMALGNGALGDLLRPALFAAATAGDTAGTDRLLRLWVMAGTAVAVLAVVFLAFLGDEVAGWLLAEEYRATAHPILVWTAAGSGLLGLSQAFESGLLALNRPGDLVPPMAIGAAVLVGASLLLVPLNGVPGAAQAATAGFAVRTASVAALLAWRRRGSARAAVLRT